MMANLESVHSPIHYKGARITGLIRTDEIFVQKHVGAQLIESNDGARKMLSSDSSGFGKYASPVISVTVPLLDQQNYKGLRRSFRAFGPV